MTAPHSLHIVRPGQFTTEGAVISNPAKKCKKNDNLPDLPRVQRSVLCPKRMIILSTVAIHKDDSQDRVLATLVQ